jgi:hypothetical protein
MLEKDSISESEEMDAESVAETEVEQEVEEYESYLKA